MDEIGTVRFHTEEHIRKKYNYKIQISSRCDQMALGYQELADYRFISEFILIDFSDVIKVSMLVGSKQTVIKKFYLNDPTSLEMFFDFIDMKIIEFIQVKFIWQLRNMYATLPSDVIDRMINDQLRSKKL